MSRVIKSLRNLEIGGRIEQLSSKSAKFESDSEQQQSAAADSGKSGRLLSRLKPGKQKSYESLMDAGSPTEERPPQQQSSQSGWAKFDDCENLIDLSSPLPPLPAPQPLVQPGLFIEVSEPPKPPPAQQQPIIIRSDNGKHGGSLDCLSVQTGGFNPSFRKESPKAKAAPAPPPVAQQLATRKTPPPRPSQPPPRPSQPPKVTASASSNALLLLDIDFGQPQQPPPPTQLTAKSRKAPAPPPPSQLHKQPLKRQQSEQSPDSDYLSPGSVCSARFDLTNPPDPGILALRRGDRLSVVRRADDNWVVARRLVGDCQEGLVACSYLGPADDIKSPWKSQGSDECSQYANEDLKFSSAASVAATPAQEVADSASQAVGGTKARSLHEYKSEHPGDLSFPAGQLISDVRRVDSDWLEGRLAAGGSRGLFPANHVRLILYAAAAAHEFPAQEAGDLALQVGDQVDVLAELPGGEWLRGVRRRRQADGEAEQVGNFPAAFVVKVQDDEAATATGGQQQQQQQRTARAIHDFTGRESDELSFQTGELLTGLTEHGADWLSGTASDGRRGLFPRAFVELL